ncbi:helix-turn-helix domain-containing protein [Streptomyces sp. AC495_CC817]|uniref:helix-turn-helix domain-containing protein n=1 Tax=Streptomyces sp. AC495_CC817 TaxID=2823900 RepID=UPI0035A8FA36
MGAVVGVTSATVSNWENGKGEPTVTQFVRWCQETKQPLELAFEGLLTWSRLSESNRRPFHYE